LRYSLEIEKLKQIGVLDAPENTEWIAYIDESGDPGINFSGGSSKYLVYGIVLVKKKNAAKARQIIDRARKKFNLPYPRVKELKFKKSRHNQREYILNQLIREPELKIGYLLYRKHAILTTTQLYKDENARYNFPLKLIIQAINRELGNQRNLEIVIDGRDVVRNKAVEDYLKSRRYLEDDRFYFTSLTFGNSSDERMLQLADFVAGAIYQNYENKKEQYKNIIFNHCFMKYNFPFGKGNKVKNGQLQVTK
jgi:hypothetical protein